MNKLLLSVLCLLAAFAAAVPCLGDAVHGVLVEERIVRLPQDESKWYVSVVGDATDARYNEIAGWFDTNASLKKLKNQVHFCPVRTSTAIYQQRYAPNVKGLPTVRVQKPDGVVVYEAAGKNLPMTAEGLYGAIAGAVNSAQGLRPILPWRRDMERRCPGPGPCPTPNPTPQPQPDPEPQPLDDGGPPDLDPQPAAQGWPLWGLVLLVNGGFLVGMAAGYGRKLGRKLRSVK
ncbi:MAG: hypothetical protein ACOY3P_23930 [Planctomycetota bacterium]